VSTRAFGPYRAQLGELAVVDHNDDPLPEGMAAVTFLMPIESARRAAEAMFLWGDMTLLVETQAGATEPQKAGEP
jgi:hypothetical protein